jgi:predicted nucleotidyltransferase
MKVVGIVAEYNPFHNGHMYHIEEAKKLTGADYLVVIMSGNFVQRGGPAIIDKYARAQAAIEYGADLVLELPVIYATASAEYFALGAISLLDKLGIVDYLCFGSEAGDIKSLTAVAKYLLSNKEDYNKDINKYMKSGMTFPEARQKALKKNNPDLDDNTISSPNNILGVEYIKALLSLNSDIKPTTISRKIAGYHEPNLNTNGQIKHISSATSIRKAIVNDADNSDNSGIGIIESHIPKKTYELLERQYKKTFPISKKDYTPLLKYKILQETRESLTSYIDISEDLANRIKNTSFTGHTFDSYAKAVKTKQWTLTRINRSLIHLLLNLKTENLDLYSKNNHCQYARVLACSKDSTMLIKTIKEKASLPVIDKVSDGLKELPSIGLKMLKEDIFASDLYNLVLEEKYNTIIKNEFQHGVVII